MLARVGEAYIRNFVFGVEDSLVSTVGLLSGVAIAGMSGEQVFVTGLILIFVEALSMSAGSFLSESSAQQYTSRSETISKTSYRAALIMFVSYALSGFVPLLPYVFFEVPLALPLSIALSVTALFILGLISARLSQTGYIKSALRMAGIGGGAILIGVLVGSVFGV